MDEVLVEEYRGGVLECVHRGLICGVSDKGEVVYRVGDVDFVTFLRSSAKPIQALPIIELELDRKLGLTDKELAVMAGSHRAELFHVKALESLLHKAGVDEEELICLPTFPLGDDAREEVLRRGLPRRRLYHNCSGKHLAILMLCDAIGCGRADYWSMDNAAQHEILRHISRVADVPVEAIRVGTDGCGVPVFAMPLWALAKAYMRLACPDLIAEPETCGAVKRLTALMNANAEMVAGTGRICSILLRDSNIVAKGGAKGVYCFGLKRERLGFAIKVLDGSEDEWPIIVASILEQIGYGNRGTIAALKEAFPLEIRNDNGRVVGSYQVKFGLKTAV